ncbi:hypothetical protein CDL15_Pgr024432 [Punica granatum]|uniref:DC1 domain-containing protein n=1 Tax=Punica granatum TaxID=22663 RepID=A0A218XXK9_PUNGR|nr:hypothetical protein CDL15_Pgr024432 [Punica granatum]
MADGGSYVGRASLDNEPCIIYDGHTHPLIFLENSNSADHDKKCNSCSEPCKDSPMFCCLTCDFTTHFQCGLLPWTLKPEKHLHKLVLKDSLEAHYVDESWYCDSCEGVGDKWACVYYCKGCNYCAEIKCVMQEELAPVYKDLYKKNGDDLTIGSKLSPPEVTVIRAGFRIQFAIDALRKVLRAYVGLRVMKSEDNISQEI